MIAHLFYFIKEVEPQIPTTIPTRGSFEGQEGKVEKDLVIQTFFSLPEGEPPGRLWP
jgi:hypothetical protein